jgi:hypothetical protein
MWTRYLDPNLINVVDPYASGVHPWGLDWEDRRRDLDWEDRRWDLDWEDRRRDLD